MSSKLLGSFKDIWHIDRQERMKIMFLSIGFFFVIAAYTIMKELKDSIFMYTVGRAYLPNAKIASMIVLIPAILIFSYLVDRMKRNHLIYAYAIFYGIIGLVFAYYLGDPVIGLPNTVTSPTRIFGWLFYFFIEGYSPFVVSLLWAYANSISSPDGARKGYPLVVAASKLGGMMTAAFAWYFFSCNVHFNFAMDGVLRHQVVVAFSSMLLLIVPIVIFMLVRTVPGYYLHGYEAVYKEQKELKKSGKSNSGVFGGLWLLLKLPYVMGIFSMIFFYEVVNVVLNYQRLFVAESAATDVAGLSCALFQTIFFVHFFGFLISFFGTSTLLRAYGERKCLLIPPIAIGVLIACFIAFGWIHLHVLTAIFVMIRAINYSISYPLRESLYVPTVKEVKFKSKSWIDSFGSKFAKSFGATFNNLSEYVHGFGSFAMFVSFQAAFFGVLVAVWIYVSYLLGKRYDKVIKNNETIGLSD